MKIIKTTDKRFEPIMAKLDNRMATGPTGVGKRVSLIIEDVRTNGNKSLFMYTKKYDNVGYTSRSVRVSPSEFAKAMGEASPKVVKAMKLSARRIKSFHARQKEKSWSYKEEGISLGQKISPLQSVGIYVPGGLASYPSSVLMNAIPAKIAGVKRIVMTTPTPNGAINPHVLVAAQIAQVDEIYKVGGAQAVAAMAYGTKTIKRVDKIVGPGNAWVAEAKRQVFGRVDIDMVAGPSEILILADGTASADCVAADLLSQAEHDAYAYPILVTTSATLTKKVADELVKQAELLDRRKVIRKCLGGNCYAFIVKSVNEGLEVANRFAPEHMELMVKKPEKYVSRINTAGAIFVGPWTPEALGDYAAGPNHVLPTGGSSRFFSPLGVYDFMKRTSVINFNEKAMRSIAKDVTTFAYEEGLPAHAKAVEVRLNK